MINDTNSFLDGLNVREMGISVKRKGHLPFEFLLTPPENFAKVKDNQI